MCGLVGIAGKIGVTEEKVLRNLLVFDSLRGEDSTGLASITMNDELLMAKAVGDPYCLFDTKAFQAIMKSPNRVLIGHNRFATTGRVNRRNAHPFECENLVGAHNGTLTEKHNIPKSNTYDVDSEALFNHISDVGIKEAMKVARGAWALSWWDKINNSINFLRNKERTLFFTFNKQGDTLFWASEQWMLSVALSRNSIEYEKIYAFDEDVWYSFNVDIKKSTVSSPKHTKINTVEVKKNITVYQGGFNANTYLDYTYLATSVAVVVIAKLKDENGADYFKLRDPRNAERDVRYYPHKKTFLDNKIGFAITVRPCSIKKNSDNTYHYRVDYPSPATATKPDIVHKDKAGNIVNEEDFLKHYNTCSWCGSPVDYLDTSAKVIDKNIGVFCGNCVSNVEVHSFLE